MEPSENRSLSAQGIANCILDMAEVVMLDEEPEDEPCDCHDRDCDECRERAEENGEPYYDDDDDWGPTPEDIAWGDGQAADMVYDHDSPY